LFDKLLVHEANRRAKKIIITYGGLIAMKEENQSGNESLVIKNKLELALVNISNDLNNLLMGISGNARILKESSSISPDGHTLLEEILHCSERCAKLANSLVSVDSLLNNTFCEKSHLANVNSQMDSHPSQNLSILFKAGTPTVLIVDDEEVVRNVTRSILESAGYRVMLANSGQEALDIFQLYHKHLYCVLLDIIMPYLSGNVVFARMKAINPVIDIFLMSGQNDKQILHEFESTSLAGFIQKPFRPDTLLTMLDGIKSEKEALLA
jgi:CheY-like chemotaxis protein